MKKISILILSLVVFTACKKDKKAESTDTNAKVKEGRTAKQNDGLTLLKGDFIYYKDAAVLQTHKEVYGVVLDDNAQKLSKQAEAFKSDPTDMVTVTVRGKISPKPEGEEGWPNRFAIKEILKVEKINPETNDVIKIGS
jgi:hypothetical protein